MNRAFNRKKDKSWMHTPDALAKHHIAYYTKFLGQTEVDQPKGTEVVKDAVRKLKFQRHIKKSEGQKIPKVELQISIYGVKILDPKTKDVQHNCQLHRISFCADDKTDKRIFTFICKDSESNKHLCYVFDSEKCAEEITLTIGQAFELAYKKFLESGGKDVETRKQIGSLQRRIQELETENSELKKQLQSLQEQLMFAQVSSLLHLNPTNDAFVLERPSLLWWCHSRPLLSCLEMSSVTLTPLGSPDSSLSREPLAMPPVTPISVHLCTSAHRYGGRESSTRCNFKKTHANIKKHNKLRKRLHQFDNTGAANTETRCKHRNVQQTQKTRCKHKKRAASTKKALQIAGTTTEMFQGDLKK
uniref:PTB domain-containing engulfment adapter protein 1 n=1 Tax=Paramormyrops kingsleyae TaxID=1676925 RepID=A0A3B3TFP8_9TELE